MAEFASKGVAGTGLGLGIAGTALGLLNGNNCGNGGILGGLFGGNNNCCEQKISALESELAKVSAEKYTDQQTLGTAKEIFDLFKKSDDKIAGVLERTNAGLIDVGLGVARLDKEIECIKTTMVKDQEINALKLAHTKSELSGAIALESERRTAGDQNLYCYVNATFVPGKLVMPKESICPDVMPRYNTWTAPTTPATE